MEIEKLIASLQRLIHLQEARNDSKTFAVTKRVQDLGYLARWVNDLEGEEVPGNREYAIDRVIHIAFQPSGASYDVVALVEASLFSKYA